MFTCCRLPRFLSESKIKKQILFAKMLQWGEKEYLRNRCLSLEAENDRLKTIIKSMKELVLNENVGPSSTNCIPSSTATSCRSATSPLLSGSPALVGDDVRFLSERMIGTQDFQPNVASSPLIKAREFDMDETFYEPAEMNKPISKEEKAVTTTPTPSPTSPILCRENSRRVRRQLLGDLDKAQKASAKMESSYDKLPEVKEPNYAYVPDKAVRGKKRKQLPGRSCNNCEKYYEAANIPQTGINECSKHRSKYPRPPSPKIWGLDLPSTQWIRERARSLPSPDKYA